MMMMMKSAVLIFIVLFVYKFGSTDAEFHFRLSPIQAKFDVDKAADDCALMGGELAHISLLDRRYVNTIRNIVARSRGGLVYIGLDDRKAERRFKWVNGNAVSTPFFKWTRGEPNNWHNEDCVVLRKGSYTMNDVACKGRHRGQGLCEIGKWGQLLLLKPYFQRGMLS